MLTVGSLCTGIGGIDLGLERAGMTVKWQADNDHFARRVLWKNWRSTPNLGDIKKVRWETVEPVDVITAGYPCQPFSIAGQRKGQDDDRHLWPYLLQPICVLRPRWLLLENVPGHLSLGFGQVLGDLAEIGYDTEWDCLPAAAFGAPHLRDRLFVVAHTDREGLAWSRHVFPVGNNGSEGDMADADKLSGGTGPEEIRTWLRWGKPANSGGSDGGNWAVEPGMGRVAYGIPDRMDRVRVLGNSVVPQVAEHIGNMIMEAERGSK